jgi:hypothetical protein
MYVAVFSAALRVYSVYDDVQVDFKTRDSYVSSFNKSQKKYRKIFSQN